MYRRAGVLALRSHARACARTCVCKKPRDGCTLCTNMENAGNHWKNMYRRTVHPVPKTLHARTFREDCPAILRLNSNPKGVGGGLPGGFTK